MNVEKLQKLWNLATRNPNENEALVAARKFVRAINREQVSVHLYKGAPPASQEDIQKAIKYVEARWKDCKWEIVD